MHTQSLTLSMLLTVQLSRLTDNDSLWETRNVCSCGNLSLIKFWYCCVYSKGNLRQKGWFGEESKNIFWAFHYQCGLTMAEHKEMWRSIPGR